LVFLGTIFIGLTFALQLWFTKKVSRSANRFLALALITIVLWIVRMVGIDMELGTHFPHWSWLPLQFSLALGPLIFFYVLKTTRPAFQSFIIAAGCPCIGDQGGHKDWRGYL
jgi:hypothetical protein